MASVSPFCAPYVGICAPASSAISLLLERSYCMVSVDEESTTGSVGHVPVQSLRET